MRFRFLLLLVMILCAFSASAQVINNTSMSAEWARTANRNAATDAADILVYNPGGLTKLGQGLHLNFGNQTLLRMPEHTFDQAGLKNYKQESPDWLVPSLFAAYRWDNFAVYLGMYIAGGGATADYDKGSISTYTMSAGLIGGGLASAFTDPKLEATSMLLATAAGGSWAINKMISISAGFRYIYGLSTIKASATVTPTFGLTVPTKMEGEAELSASGIGGVFGINFEPVKNLNIALRFDTAVSLEYETKIKSDSFAFPGFFSGGATALFNNGEKANTDLPAIFAVGVAYKFDAFRVEANLTYFFQSNADWSNVEDTVDFAALAGDCYNLGITLGWQMTKDFELSIGYVYTKYFWKDKDAYYSSVIGTVEAPSMDNHYFATGFGWKLQENLKFNFGVGMTIYPDKTIQYDTKSALGIISIDISNMAFTIAVGLDWKISL